MWPVRCVSICTTSNNGGTTSPFLLLELFVSVHPQLCSGRRIPYFGVTHHSTPTTAYVACLATLVQFHFVESGSATECSYLEIRQRLDGECTYIGGVFGFPLVIPHLLSLVVPDLRPLVSSCCLSIVSSCCPSLVPSCCPSLCVLLLSLMQVDGGGEVDEEADEEEVDSDRGGLRWCNAQQSTVRQVLEK
jgi:hypothetical protein